MFNRGKATFVSVLLSILVLTLIVLMESFFPFEQVFNLALPKELTRYIGWKLLWLIPFCFLFYKNKPKENDKNTTKTLYTDIGMFLVVTEIGTLKFIYDIQKLSAKKRGIENVEKGSILYYISSFLLYVAFIAYVVFATIQTLNLNKLNKYIQETLLRSKGRDICANEYQPEFISKCSLHFERREMILTFDSKPFWLYGTTWPEGFDVRIDEGVLYINLITEAEKSLLASFEAKREEKFSKCLNPPDADNTAEEQIELCECVLNVAKDSMIQYIRQTENKIERGENSENFDKEKWAEEMNEVAQKNIQRECGHLIHHRNHE